MCGIVGMSFRCEVTSRNHKMSTIKKVFTSMLVHAQERGSAATGLVMVTCPPNKDKSQAWVLRAPVPASEFVEMDEYKEIMEKVDSNCLTLLGHTRAVSGSQSPATDNKNNHPFIHGDIIGVHNGRLVNDTALWKKYKGKIKQKGNCDSEAIFALVDYFIRSGIASSPEEAMEMTLSESDANFALAVIDTSAPNKIHIVKDSNTPLSLGWWGQPEVTVFSSQWDYIKKSLDVHEKYYTSTSVKKCELPSNVILTLDAKIRAENWDELFVGKRTVKRRVDIDALVSSKNKVLQRG